MNIFHIIIDFNNSVSYWEWYDLLNKQCDCKCRHQNKPEPAQNIGQAAVSIPANNGYLDVIFLQLSGTKL
jgi:hypothetical protein